MSLEEAKASPHRIVQTDYDFWSTSGSDAYSWSYFGPDGKELKLDQSCGGILALCSKSTDGTIEFRWSSVKGSLYGDSLRVRGEFNDEPVAIGCAFENFLDSTYYCAPFPEGR